MEAAAAAGGYVEVLQWLQQEGHFLAPARPRAAAAAPRWCLWPEVAMAAVEGGHLPVLRFLQDHIFVQTPLPNPQQQQQVFKASSGSSSAAAAVAARPAWLQKDCTLWWQLMLGSHAKAGKLDVLQWLASQPLLAACFGDSIWSHEDAAEGGQLEVLQCLVFGKSLPCPWDSNQFGIAAFFNAEEPGIGHSAVTSWIGHVSNVEDSEDSEDL